MIEFKSKSEIEALKKPNEVVAAVLDEMKHFVKPGVTTLQIDRRAEEIIRSYGATPSFKGYGYPPFPGSVCASVNDAVVHGVPSADTVLQEGDIIGIDVGACVDGWMGDAARTYAVGEVSESAKRLIKATEAGFWAGFLKARIGNRLGDICAAIQSVAEKEGLGIVRELTGHGIGRQMHMEPNVPNYGRPGRGLALKAGLVIAVEPMFNAGTDAIRLADDEWTILTADGALSAHYENSYAITEDGPVILSRTQDLANPKAWLERAQSLSEYLPEEIKALLPKDA